MSAKKQPVRKLAKKTPKPRQSALQLKISTKIKDLEAALKDANTCANSRQNEIEAQKGTITRLNQELGEVSLQKHQSEQEVQSQQSQLILIQKKVDALQHDIHTVTVERDTWKKAHEALADSVSIN